MHMLSEDRGRGWRVYGRGLGWEVNGVRDAVGWRQSTCPSRPRWLHSTRPQAHFEHPVHRLVPLSIRCTADPANLAVGSKVGALGLQLHTRRRNRVNGTVVAATPEGGLLLQVDQSFGNCPKYIQVGGGTGFPSKGPFPSSCNTQRHSSQAHLDRCCTACATKGILASGCAC
jgi:hypothetical protein